jgi:hypothetical protein
MVESLDGYRIENPGAFGIEAARTPHDTRPGPIEGAREDLPERIG